jgi:hypothetical protein
VFDVTKKFYDAIFKIFNLMPSMMQFLKFYDAIFKIFNSMMQFLEFLIFMPFYGDNLKKIIFKRDKQVPVRGHAAKLIRRFNYHSERVLDSSLGTPLAGGGGGGGLDSTHSFGKLLAKGFEVF